ncbi:hypothetical protein PQX77_012954 [Marasmius sp. AFHP31]|nr:hypothetical protein PQX77_012954 [Marasmius sp. AFHP31]
MDSRHSERPNVVKYPSPFAVYLLGMAFHVSIEEDYVLASGECLLLGACQVEYRPDQLDNNQGITVFDVTDPMNPAFCHATRADRSSAFVPITPEQFLRGYGKNLAKRPKLAAFASGARMLDPNVLDETWPGIFDTTKAGYNIELPDAPNHPRDITSLQELVFVPAVKQAIADGDTSSLEHFLLIPEKVSLICATFRAPNFGPFNNTAIQLLSKIIGSKNVDIDLSDMALSTNQILRVLSGFDKTCRIEYLNLSHNANVTTATIRSLLEEHPHIGRLMIYGTGVSDEDLDVLVHTNPALFHHVEQVIHPAYFAVATKVDANFDHRPFRSPPERGSFHPAFSFYVTRRRTRYPTNAISLPLLNPTCILFLLCDLFTAWLTSLENNAMRDLSDSQMASLAIFSGGPSEGGWEQRQVTCCPIPSSRMFTEGWLFVFDLRDPQLQDRWGDLETIDGIEELPPNKNSVYGFLRPGTNGSQHKIYDLDGFLAELTEDGYPAPPTGLAERTVQLLDELKEVVRLKGASLSLMTQDYLPQLDSARKVSLGHWLMVGDYY